MVQGVILYSFMLMISLLALVVGHDADYNDADPDHNMSMMRSRKLNYWDKDIVIRYQGNYWDKDIVIRNQETRDPSIL